MGLKQSIVVKNEFTHNGVNTPGKGSRGGTPGQYVLRYMARVEASETITPVPESPDTSIFDYTTRYMLREDATERFKASGDPEASPYALEYEFEELDKLTGRSFGNKGISLSDTTVRDSSQEIQDAFDEGHSVQKVILSFTEDYLKEGKVLSPDYEHKGRGSYKGNIDQMKLRQAITKGVDKLTNVGHYADPEWVGVIQVDTNHVHAHLAIVDKEFSPSRLMDDGHDKGKLTQREMMNLRRGIHSELNEMKAIKGFHKQVSLERQNVVGYVKDFAYDHIGKNSRLQIMMAALPEEQHKWRYGSNRKDMQHANELAEQFVQTIFEEQPVRSGYQEASRSIDQYINERVQTEDIDQNEQERLKRNGEKLLTERSVNGVYDSFKVFDKTKLSTQTPMLDIQSSSEDELMENLSDGFDQAGFELRVRGYSNRRDHHTKNSKQYKELIDNFDETNEQETVAPDAFILRRFYEEELEWHMALADKYRSFFRLNGRRDRQYQQKYEPIYEELQERYVELETQDEFMASVADGSAYEQLDGFDTASDVFKNPQEADRQIEDLYGVHQGSRAFSGLYRDGLEAELERAKVDYTKDLREYTFDAFMDGVATQDDWVRLQPEHRSIDAYDYEMSVSNASTKFVEPNPPQVREVGITDDHFDAIKALDIHHLGVDYYTKSDRTISQENRENFAEAMQWREYFLDVSQTYLEATQQVGQLNALRPIADDVDAMRQSVDAMSRDGLIPTIEPISDEVREKRNSRTFRVDTRVDVLSSMEQHLVLSDDELDEALSPTTPATRERTIVDDFDGLD